METENESCVRYYFWLGKDAEQFYDWGVVMSPELVRYMEKYSGDFG